MIFRWLYRRRLNRAFGQFIGDDRLKEITSGTSEMQSFRMLLPRRIKRLFFQPVMSERQALMETSRMINEALIASEKKKSET